MKIPKSVHKAEIRFWKALASSIPLTMKVFLRAHMGGQTMKWFMFILTPLYTWLFLSAFEGGESIRIPTFQVDLWGANIMTIKEVIIYAMPVLCLFQWITRAKDEEGHERGESLFWGSMEGESLRRPVIRQWLDPLLLFVIASLFYFTDLRLFFFFAIGGLSLFIDELIYNTSESRTEQTRKANIGRERKRRGLDAIGNRQQGGEARPVQLVTHNEQPEYNQS